MEIKVSAELATYGVPQYATPGSAAVDLRAFWCGPEVGACVITPGERLGFETGLSLDMRGHTNALGTRLAAVILPRSGLGTKGLVLANSVGLVDEDYNAEIKVVLHNTSNKPFTIRRGDRIAQLMFVQVPRITFKVVHEFTAMASGRGGFGSTGVA